MNDTWPLLFRRVRFSYSMSQQQLGNELGVDQTTISRWERGAITPDVTVQRTIREMLRKRNPSYSVEGIALLPTHTALVYHDNIMKLRAVSAPAAQAHNLSVSEALASILWFQV